MTIKEAIIQLKDLGNYAKEQIEECAYNEIGDPHPWIEDLQALSTAIDALEQAQRISEGKDGLLQELCGNLPVGEALVVAAALLSSAELARTNADTADVKTINDATNFWANVIMATMAQRGVRL